MADSDVERVRSRVDLVDLIGHGVALQKSGKGWKGLCPFHDDRNPSFFVSPDIQRFRCWSCGATGDAFDWVMRTERLEFPEALRYLAEMVGVELTRRKGKPKEEGRDAMFAAMEEALAYFRSRLTESKPAQEYCKGRGLDQETLDSWEIGYAPGGDASLAQRLASAGHKLGECERLFLVRSDGSGGFYDLFRNRLMFPIRDERSRLVAFGGRALGDAEPKYVNSSDTPLFNKSRVLYGMHRARTAIADKKHAVLTEGYTDAIACHRAGLENSVANLGTALTEDQAALLSRWAERVTVLYDSDNAGRKAASRAGDLLRTAGLNVRIASGEDGADPDTLLRDAGPAAVHKTVERGLTPLEFKLGELDRTQSAERDEYWEAAVSLLKGEPDPLQVEQQLFALSTRYPGVRDRRAAEAALRRRVLAPNRPTRRSAPTNATIAELKPEECDFLLGLFNTALQVFTWDRIQAGEEMRSQQGRTVVNEIRKRFSHQPMQGEYEEWSWRLYDESARKILDRLYWIKTEHTHSLPITPRERQVLSGLFDEHGSKAAWAACGDRALFQTPRAKGAAQDLREQFPSEPPSFEDGEWIESLPDESKDLFIGLMLIDPLPSSAEAVQEAVRALDRVRRLAEVDRLKSEPEKDLAQIDALIGGRSEE